MNFLPTNQPHVDLLTEVLAQMVINARRVKKPTLQLTPKPVTKTSPIRAIMDEKKAA